MDGPNTGITPQELKEFCFTIVLILSSICLLFRKRNNIAIEFPAALMGIGAAAIIVLAIPVIIQDSLFTVGVGLEMKSILVGLCVILGALYCTVLLLFTVRENREADERWQKKQERRRWS